MRRVKIYSANPVETPICEFSKEGSHWVAEVPEHQVRYLQLVFGVTTEKPKAKRGGKKVDNGSNTVSKRRGK